MITKVPPPFAVSAGTNTVSGSGTVVFSNGNYTGVIPASVTGTLTLDSTYFVYLTLNQGGYDDKRELPCKAVYRRDQ